MINLQKVSGLPIDLDEKTCRLVFHDPLHEVKPDVRHFSDIKQVLMDPKAESSVGDELYYMYRDVHKPADEQLIRENFVRYDITVLKPGFLGDEFIKTVGHFHSLVPGEPYAYPELYEVLYGHALFLIQKQDPETKKVITVMAIRAAAGDKVIYPPNYGHIIVNIGKTVLVTANWVSSEYTADYDSVKEMQGMAYYVVKSNDKQFEIVANKNYPQLPEVRWAQGHMNSSLGFLADEPMYETGIRHPGRLEFLNKPHKFAVELSSITS